MWSSWSKLEKNRGGQLPPLDTSVVKNKKALQDSSAKKPLNEQSPPNKAQAIDINVAINIGEAAAVDENGQSPSPNKKKRIKKKKTRKANKLQSEAGESASGIGEISEMENQLNGI